MRFYRKKSDIIFFFACAHFFLSFWGGNVDYYHTHTYFGKPHTYLILNDIPEYEKKTTVQSSTFYDPPCNNLMAFPPELTQVSLLGVCSVLGSRNNKWQKTLC